MNDLLIIVFLVIISGTCFVLHKKNMQQKNFFIRVLKHDLRIAAIAQIRGSEILQNLCQNTQYNELARELNLSCKYSMEMISGLLNTLEFNHYTKISKINLKNLADEVIENCNCIINSKKIKIINNLKKEIIIDTNKFIAYKFLFSIISTAISCTKDGKSISLAAKKRGTKLYVLIKHKGFPIFFEENNSDTSSHYSVVGHKIKIYTLNQLLKYYKGRYRSRRKNDNNACLFIFTSNHS